MSLTKPQKKFILNNAKYLTVFELSDRVGVGENEIISYLKNNGIDVDLGLSFIGDETSYKELLLEFKNGFINQMNEIKTLYENKDIENYGIKVHALKSNCKTFGIMTFANMAYEHEMAAKNGDINFINQNITNLFVKANELYKVLDTFFGGNNE